MMYSLRSGVSFHLINWVVEGSNDGMSRTELDPISIATEELKEGDLDCLDLPQLRTRIRNV